MQVQQCDLQLYFNSQEGLIQLTLTIVGCFRNSNVIHVVVLANPHKNGLFSRLDRLALQA